MAKVNIVSLLKKLNGFNELSTLPYVEVVIQYKCMQYGRS